MPPPDPPPLIGTYLPPPVRVGDEVECRYRNTPCRVTSWTDAPLSWPRCNKVRARGGAGVWVNDDLVRAVRTESAAALGYWFGVSATVLWRWRRRFVPGDGHVRTAGDRAAHRRTSATGAAAMAARGRTAAERDAAAARSRRLGLRPPCPWPGGYWTAGEVGLLGTMPDEEVAARVGRTPAAVKAKRLARGVPSVRERRFRAPPA